MCMILVATIILPILVIADDTLWVVDYTSEGTRTGDPELVTECSYFLGKAVQKTSGSIYSMSHLMIFTKSGFNEYIADLSVEPTAFKDNQRWDKLFPRDSIREGCKPFIGTVNI